MSSGGAAILLGFLAYSFLRPPTANIRPQFALAGMIENAQQDLSIPGDYAKVVSGLSANGFHLKMLSPDDHNKVAKHQIELVGMKTLHYDGQLVAELCFLCCGQPVTIFIARKDANVSLDACGLCEDSGPWNVATKTVDNYRLVGVSQHGPREVLDLFS